MNIMFFFLQKHTKLDLCITFTAKFCELYGNQILDVPVNLCSFEVQQEVHGFQGGRTFDGPDAAETNAVLGEDHPGPLDDLGCWDEGGEIHGCWGCHDEYSGEHPGSKKSRPISGEVPTFFFGDMSFKQGLVTMFVFPKSISSSSEVSSKIAALI